MKKKIILFVVSLLLVLQTQMIFAADYNDDFKKELNRNNIGNIEKLLQKRAREMNLTYCITYTLRNKADCLDVLRLLVRYGTDVNKNHSYFIGSSYFTEEYPLELAVDKKYSVAIIQFLLDSGANPNYSHSSSDGYRYAPPLVKAYWNGDMTVVNLLLDKGANGERLLRSLGQNPKDNQMIQQLISRGIQIRSEEGARALRWAAYGGNLVAIKLLVENGVNVNARANDKDDQKYFPLGSTAASVAYDKGEMEVYNYLKANGAIDFEPRQVTQQQTAPSQSSSTTNVYVQPSAPDTSSSSNSNTPSRNIGKEIADAFKPPLQSGTYSLAGTQEKISIAGIAKSGIITQTWQGKTYQGTYNIDGNKMTVQIRGYTFVFNITSETSFSGHNETWVRTGY